MKIEVGKYYRTALGTKEGPMMQSWHNFVSASPDGLQAIPLGGGQVWRSNGSVWSAEPGEENHRLIAEWTDPQPVTLSPTWEVMDPADAAHDLERIPLPDGRVYARRVVVPVMGEVVMTGGDFGVYWAFGPTQYPDDTHRITLPTRDGALIAGTYTSADGHSVVVGVV